MPPLLAVASGVAALNPSTAVHTASPDMSPG
jgi:hypothetical protein